MDAMRRMDTPAARRVVAAASAATPAERSALLAAFEAAPHGWHPLLSTPGVGAALAAGVSAATGHLCRRGAAWSATAPDVHARVFHTFRAAIMVGALRCAAADDGLADALVAGLEGVPPLGDSLTLMRNEWGGLYVTTVDCVVGWACDAVVRRPVSIHRRRLSGCDGAAAAASGGNAYAAARARVARLASHRALLRWSVALERVAVIRAAACQAGLMANHDSTSPREGLQVWAAAAPRQLLAAVPEALERLLESVEALAVTCTLAFHVPFVTSLLSLHRLDAVDSPRLRALPAVPRVMAVAASYLMEAAHIDDDDVPVVDMTMTILAVLALYAPGRGAAVAACEELLSHLSFWATCSPDVPLDAEDIPCVGPTLAQARVPFVAASLLLYVAREAARTGGGVVPAALCTDAAPDEWRRLAAATDEPALAAVAAQLAALTASPSTRGGGGAAAAAAAPFPADAAALVVRLRRYWACGSPYRQPFDPYERALRKCGACRVAAYCTAACAAAGWGAGHRGACAGWRAYGAALAARGGGGGGPGGSPPRAPALVPFPADLSGDWRSDWGWTVAVAGRVRDAGLALTDVVAVAEPGAGLVEIVPAVEYAHRPDAVAPATLAAAAAKYCGRVLRVVLQQHPPLLRSYGPKSLRLDP